MPKKMIERETEYYEKKRGFSHEHAENVSYATANKRGLLENRHGMRHRARKKAKHVTKNK